MGLARRKPFMLLLLPLALVLVILASVTKRHACWVNPNPFWYSGLPGDCPAVCADEQSATTILGRAYKYIVLNAQPIEGGATVRTVVRCPWKASTGRVYIAAACLMFVWALIEILLAAKRKYKIFFNIGLLLTLGLGIACAVKQLDDLHHISCDVIEQQAADAAARAPRGFRDGICDKTLFTVSFILTILALVLLFAQFVYNILFRRKMNEKDVEYHNVPQTTTEGQVPMGVETHNQVPVTEAHGASENRIA